MPECTTKTKKHKAQRCCFFLFSSCSIFASKHASIVFGDFERAFSTYLSHVGSASQEATNPSGGLLLLPLTCQAKTQGSFQNEDGSLVR